MRFKRHLHQLCLLLLTVVFTSGCTKWGTRAVYGRTSEVNRKMIGAPQIAETSSSSGSLGFSGITSRNARNTTSLSSGGLSGRHGSLKRTHCVQEAEIEYVQPYQLVATEKGRVADIAGGVIAIVAGVGIALAANSRTDSFWEPGDPFYEEPPDPTLGYVIGGGLALGGAGLLGYSYTKLPMGPPPETQSSERRWTSIELVEAKGCGLVPGDMATPNAINEKNLEDRLLKLDSLHKSGLLTDEEYQAKRKQLLEEL